MCIRDRFPRPSVLALLLRFTAGHRTDFERHQRMALHTLEAMWRGGIYDHLGGGFHRYSVDRYWRVPHFEKMLYDQGQLLRVYVEAYQATGVELYSEIAQHTANFLLRDLTTHEGAFSSAEDADSVISVDDPTHVGEGAFYLWDYDEVQAALCTDGLAEPFMHVYGLERHGNTLSDPHGDLGSGNVLYRSVERDVKAVEQFPALNTDLKRGRRQLLALRARRPRPLRDDKVIAGWNGLALSLIHI